MRDAKGAREELERSLQRLKTDHFDLYQSPSHPHPRGGQAGPRTGRRDGDPPEGEGGGEGAGLGFSAHTTKGALELMKGFKFDTVMFPINYVEYFTMGFGKPILALAKEQGAVAHRHQTDLRRGLAAGRRAQARMVVSPRWRPSEELSLALRFTLSLEPVITGIPPSFVDLFEKSVAAAKTYQPASEAEVAQLRDRAAKSLSFFKREEDAVATAMLRAARRSVPSRQPA